MATKIQFLFQTACAVLHFWEKSGAQRGKKKGCGTARPACGERRGHLLGRENGRKPRVARPSERSPRQRGAPVSGRAGRRDALWEERHAVSKKRQTALSGGQGGPREPLQGGFSAGGARAGTFRLELPPEGEWPDKIKKKEKILYFAPILHYLCFAKPAVSPERQTRREEHSRPLGEGCGFAR